MASGTITDKSGRTLSGQTTEAFLISLEHIDLISVGLNCALGATDLIPYLEVLAEKAPFYVSAYPNAGLPNAFGGYDETPEMMRDFIKPFLDKKLVNILGGCCGTTPDHIKLMADLAKEYEPRKLVNNVRRKNSTFWIRTFNCTRKFKLCKRWRTYKCNWF